MATRTVSHPQQTPALHAARVDDPDGEAWHGEARQRWAEAERANPETAVTRWE